MGGPVYDMERFGLHFVASPRHADLLLVTGPVTVNMASPLRKTWEATPEPKLVVGVGECARTCGVFKGSYAIAGQRRRHHPGGRLGGRVSAGTRGHPARNPGRAWARGDGRPAVSLADFLLSGLAWGYGAAALAGLIAPGRIGRFLSAAAGAAGAASSLALAIAVLVLRRAAHAGRYRRSPSRRSSSPSIRSAPSSLRQSAWSASRPASTATAILLACTATARGGRPGAFVNLLLAHAQPAGDGRQPAHVSPDVGSDVAGGLLPGPRGTGSTGRRQRSELVPGRHPRRVRGAAGDVPAVLRRPTGSLVRPASRRRAQRRPAQRDLRPRARRLRDEGRPDPAARLAAARPPGRTESRVGADVRCRAEDGRLRVRASGVRPAGRVVAGHCGADATLVGRARARPRDSSPRCSACSTRSCSTT